MSLYSTDTALLLFTRSAAAEARVKALLPNRRLARQLASVMNQQAYQTARATGLPLFVVDEQQQSGASFGSRLHTAFAAIFSQGFDQVIAIGNDCPALTVDLIQRAQTELGSVDMVLGPSADGGVYLMGLQRAHFQELDFTTLPWQTERLFAALCELEAGGRIRTDYPLLYDIDSQEELRKLFRQKSLPLWLLCLLRHLISFKLPRRSLAFAKKNRTIKGAKLLRAPPVYRLC